jgi:excisionase family DNA binding protein
MAKFVDVPTAAKRLGIERTTLNRIILAGGLPATRYGQRWLIDESDLKRFEAKRLESPPPLRYGKAPSPGRHEILHLLATHGGATVAELAELVVAPKRSVLQWVQYHEEHGHLIRQRDPGPKEPHHCWLTDAGRRAATQPPPAAGPTAGERQAAPAHRTPPSASSSRPGPAGRPRQLPSAAVKSA